MNQEDITRTPPLNNCSGREEIENGTVSPMHLSKKVKDGLSNTQAQKRGPTTPLTPRNKQHNIIRRKMEEEPGRIRDILSFGKNQSIDIIDLNYRNWILKENLKKHQDIVKFMELERKFLLEEQ
mmetsp:Transcript_8375/g.10433  ORF Transcript_8375/g.10433 Transcript_8375/m.10433 type:complete len:124 (+) Transcript_8375:77-448(+)